MAVVAEWYRYRTVACFVTGSSPVTLKNRRVGQRCTLNLSRAEKSSRWCGVVVRRAIRGLLATVHVILNHGQVTWTTPEMAPPLLTTTPHLREDVSALDRFNVHHCPTRRVFSGTGLEPVTKQATVRYLHHSATAATVDEAHFWLNGYVNKQNCRIWSEANPQVYVETPLHPEKFTVWCALWAGGIIGPYFFKNDEGHNVTVNCDWYRAMITNFFIPELNNHDVQDL
ncbi:uncharacterized protein TNCV_951001 [Trichonephila clavipes]|nr:uncharacterized protein TNCV_951001 [Trichonephila clavipes]